MSFVEAECVTLETRGTLGFLPSLHKMFQFTEQADSSVQFQQAPVLDVFPELVKVVVVLCQVSMRLLSSVLCDATLR